jgi:hypothetical protein
LGFLDVVFEKARQAMGGKLKYMISGGAPLSLPTEIFLLVYVLFSSSSILLLFFLYSSSILLFFFYSSSILLLFFLSSSSLLPLFFCLFFLFSYSSFLSLSSPLSSPLFTLSPSLPPFSILELTMCLQGFWGFSFTRIW